MRILARTTNGCYTKSNPHRREDGMQYEHPCSYPCSRQNSATQPKLTRREDGVRYKHPCWYPRSHRRATLSTVSPKQKAMQVTTVACRTEAISPSFYLFREYEV